MSIRLLSHELASKIAAGEVVERPASVVKELLENAIDAGATRIQIEIRGGGRELVQLSDDGSGIAEAELQLAFDRHTTSKLTSAADLDRISTLGFRGEALHAISAVSHVVLVSRVAGESSASRVEVRAGDVSAIMKVGAPIGTVVAVTDLFHNVPARLKFLKSEASEKRQISELVTRYALAHPEIAFRLAQGPRVTFQSKGNSSMLEIVAQLHGPDLADSLLPVGLSEESSDADQGLESIKVQGFVSPPSLNWSTRKHLTLFVNGRWIKDNRLNYAVIQAYHTLLPVGRFPMAILFLSLPYEMVDVNVHPAKSEVRFRNPELVFVEIQRAVRTVVVGASPIRDISGAEGFEPSSWDDNWRQGALGAHTVPAAGSDHFAAGQDLPRDRLGAPTRPQDDADWSLAALPDLQLIGQVGNSYIIAESTDGLVLIDQHAAHERILYEQFMAQWQERGGGMPSQGLMTSSVSRLSPDELALVEANLDLLNSIGFQLEEFGPDGYKIRGVPAILTRIDPVEALREAVDELADSTMPLQKQVEARLITRVCKSAAIKAGRRLEHGEMAAIIAQLRSCTSPHTCPHGRPTMIHLSVGRLAREFLRR